MSLKVNEANFEQEIKQHQGYVLVDFWAEWCGPCRQISPLIDEAANELVDKIKVVKVNVDESPDLSAQFGVRGIPTLMIFKDGQQVATRVGGMPKSALYDWINAETNH
jgi:thioredoxin 1